MEKQPYHVLFLEDEPTIREVLKEYMLMSGYRVTEAKDGEGTLFQPHKPRINRGISCKCLCRRLINR